MIESSPIGLLRWGEQMPLLVVVVIGIIAFMLIKVLRYAIDSTNPSNIGKEGENEVSNILHSLPKDYLVINNVIIPDQSTDPSKNYTTQIDHVVVSPFGVFVIETKNYGGWIFGSEKSKRWKQTFKTTPGHYFYNPIKQNWGHTFALAEHLQLDIRVFKPVVVFSNDCELKVETTTPVIYMSQLKGLILNYTQEIIPSNRVAWIYDRICRINLIGEEFESKHIQSIGERLNEKQTTIQEGKCPRCGGELRLRNGKYGAFYGCSNYPKCKYTQNVK